MTTLTRLEDLLLHSREEAKGIILQLRAARKQLEENNGKLQDPQQYQQNTLLLEAIEQAETASLDTDSAQKPQRTRST
ncbi:EscE/YscE/SsaE family type III secretion system needle protein co-chaperone [Salmonella enterica]|uniref:EscE/YscE/SsaE family type III secretion system needle protein co-chaperone n=1 Tax=Salmonella enterica TaxID=28901 RepID=UPI000CCC99D0|nr:EscE/YscE/SsaE family type III secretion system needle protein co-chaperone [Salmonella enterica]PNU87082.1 EscE/YscE/SsaE family type III secretion system needle protein co-chaperone [Salmonella enterica]